MIATALLLLAQSGPVELTYAKVGSVELKLDAYRPKVATGKTFIAVHGGGFTGGSKGGNTSILCHYLAARGFTCFDINYRLQKDGAKNLQEAVQNATNDVVTAFNWVEKNCKEYGGDPKKIAIGGSSAGAIASLYATYNRKIAVRSVVDLWGGMYGTENDIKANSPALLIIHGESDKVVPFTHATALKNRASQVGVFHRFLPVQAGHGVNLDTKVKQLTLLEHIEAFLHETLK
ncbi:MAG TPA: alpha/beta hydrolase fold domain-containing protein [Fimbriimonas sp.]|nr:alpha/beta hydrolase fold domain-containing protein [Fimbriimonas sp.]